MSTDRRDLERTDHRPVDDDLSLGELFGRLGEDLGELVTTQVQLARTELRDEAREAGRTAGAFGSAAVLAHMALLLGCVAAAWGLAELMPAGWAFLVVSVALAMVAGLFYVRGRSQLDRARSDLAPKTIATLKEDVQWTRRQMQ